MHLTIKLLKQKFILHQNVVSVGLIGSICLGLIMSLFKVIHRLIIHLVLNKLFLSSLDLFTLDIISVADFIIDRVILRDLL